MTIYKAKELAYFFHDGQTRANGVTPYIEHSKAVAELVEKYVGSDSEYLISLAWLHDIFEESLEKVCKKYDIEMLRGSRVNLEYILYKEWGDWFVNDLIKLSDNWQEDQDKIYYRGKVAYLSELLVSAQPYLILIKLCDMLANIQESNGSRMSQEKRYFKAIQCLKMAERKDLTTIHHEIIKEIETTYFAHQYATANHN